MTYACPAWELAAETHRLKLQRLQNRVLHTIGNFPRRTSVRDLRVAYVVYDYITKLCRKQEGVIQNHNGNVCDIVSESIRGLNLRQSCVRPFSVYISVVPSATISRA
jgi:hypothetical protein